MRTAETTNVLIRLPVDAKTWLEQQAQRNGSSQNSEIIRCVRDRMEGLKRQEKVA